MGIEPISRFLVTGGAGFVGARVVHQLVERGNLVRVLDHGAARRLEAIAHRIEVLPGDITDDAAVAEAVTGIDAVIHLAANGLAYGVHTPFEEVLATNVVATRQLILAAGRAGVKKLVHAGSVFEHGYGQFCKAENISHDTPFRPVNLYGVSKAAASMLAPLAGDEAGVETVTLRLFSPYGPGEDPIRFVPAVILAAMSGQPLKMTAGEQVRDFCYVDDVAKALIAAAETSFGGHQQFNLGTGNGLSLAEAANIILAITGRTVPLELGAIPYRPGEPNRLVADPIDLHEALSNCLTTSFEDGCRLTFEWIQANEPKLGLAQE